MRSKSMSFKKLFKTSLVIVIGGFVVYKVITSKNSLLNFPTF